MGVLDDLLRQLQEAAEQQRRTTLPGTPRATPARAEREQVSRERVARKYAEQRQLATPSAPVEEGSVTVRTTVDAPPAQSLREGQQQHPWLERLRAPGGAREALILSEILRRPDFRWRWPRQ